MFNSRGWGLNNTRMKEGILRKGRVANNLFTTTSLSHLAGLGSLGQIKFSSGSNHIDSQF